MTVFERQLCKFSSFLSNSMLLFLFISLFLSVVQLPFIFYSCLKFLEILFHRRIKKYGFYCIFLFSLRYSVNCYEVSCNLHWFNAWWTEVSVMISTLKTHFARFFQWFLTILRSYLFHVLNLMSFPYDFNLLLPYTHTLLLRFFIFAACLLITRIFFLHLVCQSMFVCDRTKIWSTHFTSRNSLCVNDKSINFGRKESDK